MRDPVDECLQAVAPDLGERGRLRGASAEPRLDRVQLVVAVPTTSPAGSNESPRAPRTAAGPRLAACPCPPSRAGRGRRHRAGRHGTISSSASRHRGDQVEHPPKVGGPERVRLGTACASRPPARAGTAAAPCSSRAACPSSATTRSEPDERDAGVVQRERDLSGPDADLHHEAAGRRSSPPGGRSGVPQPHPGSAARRVVVLRGAIERDGARPLAHDLGVSLFGSTNGSAATVAGLGPCGASTSSSVPTAICEDGTQANPTLRSSAATTRRR